MLVDIFTHLMRMNIIFKNKTHNLRFITKLVYMYFFFSRWRCDFKMQIFYLQIFQLHECYIFCSRGPQTLKRTFINDFLYDDFYLNSQLNGRLIKKKKKYWSIPILLIFLCDKMSKYQSIINLLNCIVKRHS